MPSPPAPVQATSADLQWTVSDGSKPPVDLVITDPGQYTTLMRRVRNFDNFSIIADWALSDPADPASRIVSSDIAGTLIVQVSNIGDLKDKPYGRYSWVTLPACQFNLQTDSPPFVSLINTAAFAYMRLLLNITAGTGTFFAQFSGTES